MNEDSGVSTILGPLGKVGFTSQILFLCGTVCQTVTKEQPLDMTCLVNQGHHLHVKSAGMNRRAIPEVACLRSRIRSASESSVASSSMYPQTHVEKDKFYKPSRTRMLSEALNDRFTVTEIHDEENLSVEDECESANLEFPIQDLPFDCKIKILSFLTPAERGVAAQVCREWYDLTREKSLWSTVDLTALRPCALFREHECDMGCYVQFKARLKSYISYLCDVQPVIKRLKFELDIGDKQDSWLETIEVLLSHARLECLTVAQLNWRETPAKPLISEEMSWTASDYQEMVFRHRHRQRLFQRFLSLFVQSAPNVRVLMLPFAYAPRTIELLGELKYLDTLVLEKYFIYKTPSQETMDNLMKEMPNLRKLIIEIWTQSGKGLLKYNLSHDSLELLDVSQCRGFYVCHIDMPKLATFKVSRHPWRGELICLDEAEVPCLHKVLSQGAPKLQHINEHKLSTNWNFEIYRELQNIMATVCSCREHKSCSWAV